MPEPNSKEPLNIYSKNGTVITVRSPIRNKILTLLAEEGPVSFSRIMEYTGLSKSTVSGYVCSLEMRELISVVPDPRDARKKTYVVTASLIGDITPSTQNGLTNMPRFKVVNSATVITHDEPPMGTALWVFCADPAAAPQLRGVFCANQEPAIPQLTPGEWTFTGPRHEIPVPKATTAWEWRNGNYVRAQTLLPGRAYWLFLAPEE